MYPPAFCSDWGKLHPCDHFSGSHLKCVPSIDFLLFGRLKKLEATAQGEFDEDSGVRTNTDIDNNSRILSESRNRSRRYCATIENLTS
jgi:hypothetical protein